MKQLNIKTPLVFRIGVALLCAMLITSHMTGGLYARYHFGATGNSTASVAKFSVSCSSSDDNTTKTLEIGSEETVTYSFTVTNTSDVTIQYTITIENLPQGVNVSGNSGTFTLKYGASENHTLTFKATDSAAEVTEQKVSIKINAVQVD